MINRISVADAAVMLEQQEMLVVDIRDPQSFSQGHIEGATRIDNSNLAEFLEQADKSKPILVCCYHGNSSQPAAQLFYDQGFAKSYSLDGGMSAWGLGQPLVAG